METLTCSVAAIRPFKPLKQIQFQRLLTLAEHSLQHRRLARVQRHASTSGPISYEYFRKAREGQDQHAMVASSRSGLSSILLRSEDASTSGERVHPACEPRNPMKKPCSGVPVYVMLPLDSIDPCQNIVNSKHAMSSSLQELKTAGVEGVMMDIWWGIVERDEPGRFEWRGYKELISMVHNHGLKIQAVMSFHQCGGNVGDSCLIPLPKWVVEEIDRNPDLAYTDKGGRRNYEYVSLGSDTLPVLRGRTPLQVYSDYMRSFRNNFKEYLGNCIVEVQVGMGPAGELRYPSYPESNGIWRFPGIGEFQCYDKYMLSSLKGAATAIGRPEWGHAGPHDSGSYNDFPEDTDFFRRDGRWNSYYGEFFLQWYSSLLLAHGERVLSAANDVFRETSIKLSGKVGGIHWHYGSRSHAAELTAGYYNTRFRDGYLPIFSMFGRHCITLNFTCIEMKDSEQPIEARCSPESLVKQVVLAARNVGVCVAGENALPRFDEGAQRQVVANSRLTFEDDPYGAAGTVEPMCAFTFLRMSKTLFQCDNWRQFVSFVMLMREGTVHHDLAEDHKISEIVQTTRMLIKETAAAFT
ncbi:hypothetical protein KP509_10G090400 [Ceratopteris richardii]|uniref:Beta-amylase n=1 Tax=Ceratopteris richardii TaxID=49495 RepID=A0A8T2U173_CERRI|nr:hypothetical protein KP509_10G090300 [Ceratopteris richardii]KAH7428388.1 hypothetical protein KP509_10G090400 [Ceratopteris richardii]